MDAGSYNKTADYYSLGVILYEMAVSPDHFREIKENQSGSLFTTVISEFKTCQDIFLFELIAMVSISRALPSLYRQNPFQVIQTLLGVQNTQLYITGVVIRKKKSWHWQI